MTALLPLSPCKSLMVSTNVMQLHHSNLGSLGVKTNHRKVLIICVKVTYYGCVVMNLCIKLESSLCPILTLVFCFVLFYFISLPVQKNICLNKNLLLLGTKGKENKGICDDTWRQHGLRKIWLVVTSFHLCFQSAGQLRFLRLIYELVFLSVHPETLLPSCFDF